MTFRLGEGKVVLLGGLARVEVVTGRPFLLTFFVSNDVRLHPTDTRRCVWALFHCCCCVWLWCCFWWWWVGAVLLLVFYE